MQILVRKYTSRSKSPVFHPHFNRTMGRYYHTASDYYGDLKSKGLQPSTGYEPKPKGKPYKMSEWGKAMTQEINNASRNGKYKPSGRFIDEMKKKGMDYSENGLRKARKIADSIDSREGGFGDGEKL